MMGQKVFYLNELFNVHKKVEHWKLGGYEKFPQNNYMQNTVARLKQSCSTVVILIRRTLAAEISVFNPHFNKFQINNSVTRPQIVPAFAPKWSFN